MHCEVNRFSTDKMVSLADETFNKVEWQKLEEELTCSSCGNLFLEPKTLSCLHTLGLALKNQSSSDNPVILAIERYWMTSCKSRL